MRLGLEKIKLQSFLSFLQYVFMIVWMYYKVQYVFFDVANLWWQWGTICLNFGLLLLFTGWTFCLRPKARWISLIAINIVYSFILFADTLYFRYFRDFISIPVLVEFFQLHEIGGSILALVRWNDSIFLIDFVFVGFIALLKRIFLKRNYVVYSFSADSGRNARKPLLAILMCIIGIVPLVYQIRMIKQTTPALFSATFSHLAVANQLGIMGYHIQDVDQYVVNTLLHREKLSNTRKQQVVTWFQQQNQSAKSAFADSLFGIAKDKNIIVIQLESFQNWVIGKKIDNQEITPNLNGFLKQSMYFPNYYRQTAQGRTADAEFLSLNSLYPLASGSVYFRYVTDKYESLPKILTENGYQTSANIAFDPTFWNREAMYKGEGFQIFHDVHSYNIDETFGLGLTDESFFNQTIPKLKQQKSPFFSFLITLSSHGPFEIPEKYQTLKIGNLKGTMVGNYIESAHYTDQAIGNFLNQLKTSGLLDQSIVVFYGDHDSGIAEDDPNYDQVMHLSPDDALGWYKQMKVPLIIHLPGNQHAGIYTQTKGELDLTPTLLHLVGVATDDMPLMGQDVTNPANQLVVFRDNSFTDGRYFFITNDGSFEHGKCYDAKTGALVNKSVVANEYKEAKNRLQISDDILKSNILPNIQTQLTKTNGTK